MPDAPRPPSDGGDRPGGDEPAPPPTSPRPPVRSPAFPVAAAFLFRPSPVHAWLPAGCGIDIYDAYGLRNRNRWLRRYRTRWSWLPHVGFGVSPRLLNPAARWEDCLDPGPLYSWDQYTAALRAERDKDEAVDEAASCATVSVDRTDGAGASFDVPLPALGASTPDELHSAIRDRLDHGEVVELTVVLRPDQVEDVRVRRCEADPDRDP